MKISLLKIKFAILAASNAYNISPKLIDAIIKTESGYNQNAVGASHGEIGLMQLRPDYHDCAVFDVWENIYCGVAYLAEIKKMRAKQWGDAWFVGYNHGPNCDINYPEKTKYYRAVMNNMDDEWYLEGDEH